MHDPLIAALLGAFIGAAFPIGANIISKRTQLARRAEQLALAIAAEVSAVREIARRREYLAEIRRAQSLAKQGTAWLFKINVTREYFPVIEGNMVDIGMLGSQLPRLVPQYLTFAKSFLEDLHAINAGRWDAYGAEQLESLYGQLAQLFEDALRLGEEIVAIVGRLYPHAGPAANTPAWHW